jgi:hypothetical protein
VSMTSAYSDLRTELVTCHLFARKRIWLPFAFNNVLCDCVMSFKHEYIRVQVM